MMNSLYTPYKELSAREKFRVGSEILNAQAQIIFSKKFWWFVAGVLLYVVVSYFINYNQQLNDRLTQRGILVVLVEIPLLVLTIFLNMQLVGAEKDSRTLELLFTMSGSRYKVWLLRLGTINGLLFGFAILLSLVAFFAFAETEILATALVGAVPGFVIGALTFYLSIKFRSSFGAAMVSALITVLLLMFYEALESTKYNLFFNPWDTPHQVDPQTWRLWMWQNRVALFLIGVLLQFFGLRGLERRERLLG